MPATRTSPRQILSFFVLGAFVTFVLLLGISNEAADDALDLEDSLAASGSSLQKEPDFEQYVRRRTLSDEELDFGTSNRRILFVGDVHGMNVSLEKLLKKLSYDSEVDYLVHVGDIVAKGPLEGSLDVLAYMTTHNITGARGNHDQMVIGWRAWIDDVLSHPGGANWLETLERKSSKELKGYLKNLKKDIKKGKEEHWKRIPSDWEFMGDHYRIARAMSAEQASYLRALPLALYIPRLHAFVIHAGLLPLDPRRSPTSLRQPLAHIPDDHFAFAGFQGKKRNVTRLRTKQEEALLTDVPQNVHPWVLLNMRSILKDNSVSKDSKEGTAWAPLWNAIISRCGGFELELEEEEDDEQNDDTIEFRKSNKKKSKPKLLPCYPSTVVYGHAASRGLDIERWTKGLDSGCVYGRKLTALVLTPPGSDGSAIDDIDDEGDVGTESRKKKMRFGDAGSTTAEAQVVSVPCPIL